MDYLPKAVIEAWEEREGPIVLATVNHDGKPNIIYAGAVSKYGDNRIVIADNYFDKTRANIFSGSKGSILFITKQRTAYQIKGNLEYHTSGKIYEEMKKWNTQQHPGHAALALKAEEVYSGAQKLG